MRKINYIAIHCTATPQNTTIDSILNYWRKNLGWKSPGYHFIIEANGNISNLLPIKEISNGVAGYNSQTINIAYIGGFNGNKPIDNRTREQKKSLEELIIKLHIDFPNAKIQGHRDFPNVKKDCPSFDVEKWLNEIGI